MLILIRGISGSGKSTYAKKHKDWIHLEADFYFTNEDGSYHFAPLDLPKAHAWCQKKTAQHLAKGKSVCVANTFIQAWEIKPYLLIAKKHNAKVKIIEMQGNFNNIHGLTQEKIQKQKKQFEKKDLIEKKLKGHVFEYHINARPKD